MQLVSRPASGAGNRAASPPIAGWHAFCSFVEEVCVRGNAWAFQNVSGVVRERRGDLGETENRRTI
jgi:hypothetical protein